MTAANNTAPQIAAAPTPIASIRCRNSANVFRSGGGRRRVTRLIGGSRVEVCPTMGGFLFVGGRSFCEPNQDSPLLTRGSAGPRPPDLESISAHQIRPLPRRRDQVVPHNSKTPHRTHHRSQAVIRRYSTERLFWKCCSNISPNSASRSVSTTAPPLASAIRCIRSGRDASSNFSRRSGRTSKSTVRVPVVNIPDIP